MGNLTFKRMGYSPSILLIFVMSISIAACDQDIKSLNIVWKGFTRTCDSMDPGNSSISCHGVRIVRRIVQEFLERSAARPSIEIFNGISLVKKSSATDRKARLIHSGSIMDFLENRQLQVKLTDILPYNFESLIATSLPNSQGSRGDKGGGGKGGGGYLLMAMMMGKMVAALGFGALAMLAMKALMVSALALTLSLVVALKKLSGGHEDHGGGEHHVVYAQEIGHHHRKRSATNHEDIEQSPYRGYTEIYSSLRAS
ncbi:uncharacterized protein [Prorops nasuta]|uniref:uncharacterized protein n=1 Tax=Prorops nasuta TaxID=863751 RepID=UPI0034CE45DF